MIAGALVASLAVGVGGCGGSSSGPLTQAQFASRGNEVCRKSNTEQAALTGTEPATMAGLGAEALKLEPIANELVGGLSSLHPPLRERSLWNKYVADGRIDISLLETLHAAALAGDTTQVQTALITLQSLADDAIANALGLTQCAINVGPQTTT